MRFMESRHQLCSLAVFLAFALGCALAQEEKQPVYQDKSLSEWLKQLRSPKVKDRREAALVLAMTIGPEGKAAVPALSEALKDEAKEVRRLAADALGAIGKEARPAVLLLVRALKDKDPGVSNSAAFTLFVLGPEAKAAVPDLVEALKDKDPGVRVNAAFLLGGIGKEAKAAVPALMEALKDPKMRVSAADALGGIGKEAKRAVPALIKALKDKDPAMRVSAAGALYGIGAEGKAAVAALSEALKDKDINARKFAACALGKMGPEAKEAVPALKEALKEKTRDVRQAAAWALFAIDPKAAKKAGVPEPLTRYRAYIGTSPKGFERDDVPGNSFSEVSGQGGDIISALLLWVNGDPVGFVYTSDWREVALTSLRPGRNELTLSGKHSKPVYVKIDKWGGGGFAGPAGKRRFPGPGGKDREEPLLFQVERAPKLPQLEELSDRPVDRARYEKEVRAAIAELKGLVRGGKGQEAARLLTVGPLLWAAAEGLTPEEARKEFLDPTKKALSDPKVKAVDEGRPLRLRFGKRLVLAYVEPPATEGYSRHLFAVERAGKQTLVGPFQLARVGGKWIFWDTEIIWDK